MALKPYLVQRSRTKSVDGVTALAVMATDAAEAKVVANSYTGKDRPGAWSNATVTEIAATSTALVGYSFRFILTDPADDSVAANVTVTGDATNDTIDEIAALAVTALNALSNIAAASYDAATNILTVAGAADGLGDHNLAVHVADPSGEPINGTVLVGAITDEGVAGAAVTVALKADAGVVPKVVVAAGAF